MSKYANQNLKSKYKKKLKTLRDHVFMHIKNWLKTFGPILAFSLFWPLSVAMKHPTGSVAINMDSIMPKDLLIPLAMAISSALFVSIVYYLIFQAKIMPTIVASLLLITAIWNFQERLSIISPTLKALFPIKFSELWPYSVILLVILLTLCGYISYWIMQVLVIRKPTLISKIATILSVLAVFLFVINLVPLGGYLWGTKNQIAYRPSALTKSNSVVIENKPDIYYIVLDRHSNNEILKQQLNFDNSDFINSLSKNGYFVNDNAYSTYPYTAMSIGTTMTANLLGDLSNQYREAKHQTTSLLFQLTRYSSVAKALKDEGYEYNVIGSWYGVSNKSHIANNIYYEGAKLHLPLRSKTLSEFDRTIFRDSVYAEFFQKMGLYSSIDSHSDQAKYQLDTLNQIIDKDKNDNISRFTFTHILLPHDPYVFNADGSVASVDSSNNNNGKLIQQKYIDQLKYIDSEIDIISNKILTQTAGNAIIILQADEGYYPQVLLGNLFSADEVARILLDDDMTKWSDEFLRAKYGILAAYHLPGATQEELAKGANSTNIFRLVLNHYFGYQLPYLPICNFAMPQGRAKAFTYTDITPRLSDNPDPACKTIHD